MLVKVDLPINKTVAERILHPSLYLFLNRLRRWDIPGKAWMCSDSSILYKNNDTCSVINIYNQRTVSFDANKVVYFPYDLNGLTIYRRIDTFQQNHFGAYKEIITAVTDIYDITTKQKSTIYGIGGEYYIYFLLFREQYKSFHGFSNNENTQDIAQKNLLNYLKIDKVHLKIVDYNSLTFNFKDAGSDIIINLSTIPLRLLQSISDAQFSNIIIITCNQNQFNKRRQIIETNYRLRRFTHISLDTTVVSIFCYSPKK